MLWYVPQFGVGWAEYYLIGGDFTKFYEKRCRAQKSKNSTRTRPVRTLKTAFWTLKTAFRTPPNKFEIPPQKKRRRCILILMDEAVLYINPSKRISFHSLGMESFLEARAYLIALRTSASSHKSLHSSCRYRSNGQFSKGTWVSNKPGCGDLFLTRILAVPSNNIRG